MLGTLPRERHYIVEASVVNWPLVSLFLVSIGTFFYVATGLLDWHSLPLTLEVAGYIGPISGALSVFLFAPMLHWLYTLDNEDDE